MRLPVIDGVQENIDMEQLNKMVDEFLGNGFTYFDTSYAYHNGKSEEALRKSVVERYPREQFTIATKLPTFLIQTEDQVEDIFAQQLKNLGTDYVDYYLLHAMMEGGYKKYDKFHLWDFVGEQKAKGLVKHMGFSFHAGPQLLDRLLKEHPEVDFVQLQINYADWENPSVTARANYEVARKHGKSIVVMEPVKGGNLANPPAAVKRMFDEYHPDMSYASWAIRFVASLDGIITVLSGMSNTQQMEDNLSYMKKFQPLNEAEQKIIQEAQRILGNSSTIPCTACHYCTEGCPKKIPIPEIFSAMNKQLGNGQIAEAASDYRKATSLTGKASECINCRQCERICPQHLGITGYLKQCADAMET